jgi:hypothetical protein
VPKVRLSVGAHEVELDSDGATIDHLVGKALYLFERTADEARSVHIGFDTPNVITEIFKSAQPEAEPPKEETRKW